MKQGRADKNLLFHNCLLKVVLILKNYWKVIDSVTGKKNERHTWIVRKLKASVTELTDMKILANSFNQYFCSITTKLSGEI